MNYTTEQLAIFDFMKNGTGHGVVEALAGSGKTSTGREGIKQLDPSLKILYAAFNNHIVKEATGFPSNVQVLTLNAFGYRAMRKAGDVQLDASKTDLILRSRILTMSDSTDRKNYQKYRGVVRRLVSLLKSQSVYKVPTIEEIDLVADKFGVEIEGIVDFCYDLVMKVYEICLNTSDDPIIDFDDQIFLPMFLQIPIPQFDIVFVDELQDLTIAQHDLVIAAGKRVIGVGDENQAIYSFRGADPDSIGIFKKRLSATRLPLYTCFRCSKAVIAEAQKIVPEIRPCDGAIEGSVKRVKVADFDRDVKDVDMVLCRTTAPLVSKCLSLIRQGRKAYVRGRDLGMDLTELLVRINNIPHYRALDIKAKIEKFQSDETAKLRRREKELEIEALNDRVESLLSVYETVENPTVDGIRDRILSIFQDTSSGVLLCTVHRSKGLQNRNVWILRPDLMPHPAAKKDWQRKQEQNLKYVAITRSQENLYFVESK